ncbi:MAG: hypothetical protein GXP28_05430 [Planctomycetes bacterium]|nr:hypothetical protein [Planctomycetota bacterium]
MVYQQIEKVKQEYTDKYVVVDADQPELARFGDLVGQVKTVNMSGRALVEFGDYHKNIAWYDIDLDYLKVVDKPAPQDPKQAAAKKKSAAKPAAKKADAGGEKKLSPLEMARMQDSGGKKPAAKAKPSTADILAAARGDSAPAAKAEPKKAAAPDPPAAAAPGKVDRSKMSVDEMVAYCREKDAG